MGSKFSTRHIHFDFQNSSGKGVHILKSVGECPNFDWYVKGHWECHSNDTHIFNVIVN